MCSSDLLAIGLAATSCSGVKECAAPQLGQIPTEVPGIAPNDSATMADMEWWRIYTDSDLADIITEALEHNRDLAIAMARVEEARQTYGIARLNLTPTISGLISADYETNDYSGKPHSADPEYDIKATVAWEIDLMGGRKWERRGAEAS